jgi:UDP-N-acetylglucosamine--N-acetylmuramyl-(pentapeptide) pyrophosphoryl-undecaprenol N-acetylglucosamine transferase
MESQPSTPRVAIACGGTGGHLFPGLAVAGQLLRRGCAVTLLVSPKEVDKKAVQAVSGMQIATLPAIGLTSGRGFAFLRGFAQSCRAARKIFKLNPPDAVLAMGGFTSAPPALAGKFSRLPVFLHESNTIPGKANRWLSRLVDQAFVGFSEAAPRLRARRVKITGTPVRPQFQPLDPAACRVKLGLDPQRPVLLVVGGSQGASGINDLVIPMLPILAGLAPDLQLCHLAGPKDAQKVQDACAAANFKAVVHPFFAEMELALGAASVALSRAGASSLAELAAMRVPAVLVPYPAATDDHQYYNALAFERSGAARLFRQQTATPEMLAPALLDLIANPSSRERMRAALEQRRSPRAAEEIADSILKVVADRRGAAGRAASSPPAGIQHQQSALT